ncbi:hypothetical protein [Streptomyces sp. Tu 3180]|uniref:hypothetical protein n=1 Tax=Streptomyces sp. Tu 3180 TaxID=2682611 RepID=UPI001AA0A929|nr:hypothetical protein [Streptomyces sp. Tu 3180]
MAVDPLIEPRDVNQYFGNPRVLRDSDLRAHGTVPQHVPPERFEVRGSVRPDLD